MRRARQSQYHTGIAHISVSAVLAGDWSAKQVLWTQPALFPVPVLSFEHQQVVYVKVQCFSHTGLISTHFNKCTGPKSRLDVIKSPQLSSKIHCCPLLFKLNRGTVITTLYKKKICSANLKLTEVSKSKKNLANSANSCLVKLTRGASYAWFTVDVLWCLLFFHMYNSFKSDLAGALSLHLLLYC